MNNMTTQPIHSSDTTKYATVQIAVVRELTVVVNEGEDPCDIAMDLYNNDDACATDGEASAHFIGWADEDGNLLEDQPIDAGIWP